MTPLESTISVLRDLYNALGNDDLEPGNIERLMDEVKDLLNAHLEVKAIWAKFSVDDGWN